MILHNEALDRLPPQNIEAEQCVLGSMLLDREMIGEVLLLIDAEDFYMPGHAECFRVLSGLYDRNEPVDLVLVTNDLSSRGRLEAVGGVEFLVGLMESVPNAAHALAYARLVRDTSERRRLMGVATEILRDAQDGSQRDVSELLDSAEQKIFAIAHGRGQ
ncbi:MAG TPA: DnaB-like helicase N-terminal domain-containing protein, partial [Planctomycetota bacterium]|nr:DnaB-like helicase N-terminal domain-containing protein [Planctomycetota bacterium]